MDIEESMKIRIMIFDQKFKSSEIALEIQEILIDKRSRKESIDKEHEIVVDVGDINLRFSEINKRSSHFI